MEFASCDNFEMSGKPLEMIKFRQNLQPSKFVGFCEECYVIL